MECGGVEWSAAVWSGVEWSGVERCGVDRSGVKAPHPEAMPVPQKSGHILRVEARRNLREEQREAVRKNGFVASHVTLKKRVRLA